MSRSAPEERNTNNDEDAEFDQVDETVNGIIYNKVYHAAEMFAGTYVGQYATGKLDRLLKLIEDTAKWSLPQHNPDKNDSNTPLERPLPWVPFIAMILMLRIVRLSLSLAGLFIGNAPLVPSDVVYFIQTRRRKLRAIRIAGMRDIRRKEQARGKNRSGGLVSKLRSLLSVVVCRPGQGREVQKNTTVRQNSIEGGSRSAENESQVENDNQSKGCQSADDVSDQELTLDQIIDKYGDASDGNDSDFIPSNDALNNEDTSATSSSSEEEDEQDNDDNENDKELNQSSGDANPEHDATMTNGNRRSKNSSSSTENQSNDNSVVIRENGNEQNSKSSRKPVPMPKPFKLEPVPAPIQEIKQEPFDSDEGRSCNPQSKQDPAVLKRSTEQHQHQQHQADVAQNDNNPPKCDVPKDNEILKGVVETADVKENGFENPWENDETSGSPNMSGTFGFHPTSILKNPNAVHLEKRGPAVVYSDEDITSGADRSLEINETSRPIYTPHLATKGNNHNNGKHNKNNKFKGKRR